MINDIIYCWSGLPIIDGLVVVVARATISDLNSETKTP